MSDTRNMDQRVQKTHVRCDVCEQPCYSRWAVLRLLCTDFIICKECGLRLYREGEGTLDMLKRVLKHACAAS